MYNGVNFFKYVPKKLVHLDACPIGLRTIFDQVCTMTLSSERGNKHIEYFERIDLSVLFNYLGFYIAFNTVQIISRRGLLWADETRTYSWSSFCTANCLPLVRNCQLSHIRSGVSTRCPQRWEASVLPLRHNTSLIFVGLLYILT